MAENKIYDVWMFHGDCAEGKIFKSSELDRLKKDGWVDSPAKIQVENKKQPAKDNAKKEK